MTRLRCQFAASWAVLVLLMVTARAADPADGAQFFREKIEPALKAHCYRCHSAAAKEVKGELRLDTRSGLARGGETGPVLLPGKSGESLLIQALRHEGGSKMPPDQPKLPDALIADFVEWIDLGAPDPRTDDPAQEVHESFAAARQHWAFQPVRKVTPPSVNNAEWPRMPVDAFVLSRLEERGWQPAPVASRGEWLRRVYFDLVGLPPSPEEVEAFLNDPSPDAFERVVDRLLSSPLYGERWAQHWLDVVRYAESEGYEYDRHLPDAWRFRDYVIDSLNRDKPFDQFVREQIAGDELDPENTEYQTAAIFHRLGPVRRNAGNPDIALSRNEVLTERTDILGTAFLGLTVGCARCHNHKLEPISQKDYYRLQAYLAATDEHNISLARPDEQQAWEEQTATLKQAIQRLKSLARQSNLEEKERLERQAEELEDQLPAPLATIPATWNDFAHRTAIHVLRRGVWENKAEPVGPRPLSVLMSDELPELPADVSNPRTHLANWLTNENNPLTPRVIVNRVWQQHFGVGLVKTANDFGAHGDPPSHPELLDWLTASLIENGWHLKPIHRLIVLSSAYRQSSRSAMAGDAERLDPENRLLWRFNRRRLSAEELRDAMLAVSGRLNLATGGPSVMVPVDPEMVRLLYKPSQWQVTPNRAEHDRRSIYLIAKRNLRLPFMDTFDAPVLLTSCPRRETSTHAHQALELLNGTLSNDLTVAFVEHLRDETDGSPEQMIERAFRLTAGREPTSEERALSLQFLRDQPQTEFALAMFNLNGFLYVP